MSSISDPGPNVVSLEPWNAHFFIMNMFKHDPCIHDFAVKQDTRGIRGAFKSAGRQASVFGGGGKKDELCKIKNIIQKGSVSCEDIGNDNDLKDFMENNDVSEIIENIQDIDCESDVVRVVSKVLSNMGEEELNLNTPMPTPMIPPDELKKYIITIIDPPPRAWGGDITNEILQRILKDCKERYNPLYNEYDILLILTEIANEKEITLSVNPENNFLKDTIVSAQNEYESAHAGGGVGHPGGDYTNGQKGGTQEAGGWTKEDDRGKGSQWQAAVFKHSLLYFKTPPADPQDLKQAKVLARESSILKRGGRTLSWNDEVYQCVWNILPNSYNATGVPPSSIEFKNEYFDQLLKAFNYFANIGGQNTILKREGPDGNKWNVEITNEHLNGALKKINTLLQDRVGELKKISIDDDWCQKNPPSVGDNDDDNYTIFKTGTRTAKGQFTRVYSDYFRKTLTQWQNTSLDDNARALVMRNTFADIINATAISDGVLTIENENITYNDVLFLMNEYLNIITVYNYIKEPIPESKKTWCGSYAFKFENGGVKSATFSLGRFHPKSEIAGQVPQWRVDPNEYTYLLHISLEDYKEPDSSPTLMAAVDIKLKQYEKIIIGYITELFNYEMTGTKFSISDHKREKDMIEFSLNCVSAIIDNVANEKYREGHRKAREPSSQLGNAFWNFYGPAMSVRRLGWKVGSSSRGSDSDLMNQFKVLLQQQNSQMNVVGSNPVVAEAGTSGDKAQAKQIKKQLRVPDNAITNLKTEMFGLDLKDQFLIYINNAASNSIIKNPGVNNIQGTFNIASVIDSQTAFPRFTNNQFCRKNSEFKNMDITIISNDYDGKAATKDSEKGLFYRVRVIVDKYTLTGDITAKIEAYLIIEGQELIHLEEGDGGGHDPIIIDTTRKNSLEAAVSLVRLVDEVFNLFNKQDQRTARAALAQGSNPTGKVDTNDTYKFLQDNSGANIPPPTDRSGTQVDSAMCKRLIMEQAFKKGLGDYLQEILAWAPNRGYVKDGAPAWGLSADHGYRMSPGGLAQTYDPLTPRTRSAFPNQFTVLQLNGDQPSAMRVMFFNNLRRKFFSADAAAAAAGEEGANFWKHVGPNNQEDSGEIITVDNKNNYFYNSVGGYFILNSNLGKNPEVFNGMNQYVVRWKVNYATISCIYNESTGQYAGGEAVAVDRKKRKTRKTRKKRRVKYSTIRRKSKKTRRSRRKRRKRRRHTTRN